MRIGIGTRKPVKIQAFREILQEYGLFSGVEVVDLAIESGVPEQPLTLDEIGIGAYNRAARAFEYRDEHGAFDIGVGIESGLFPFAPDTMFDACVCSIFDGKWHNPGMSSGVKFPEPVIQRVQDEGITVRQAGIKLGHIKDGEGLLEKYTGGHITRLEHIRQAVRAALAPFGHPEFYR